MARRTFGPAGRIIEVVESEVRKPVAFEEPISGSDAEPDRLNDGNDSGNEAGEGIAFEPVGATLRTEPIAEPESRTESTGYTDPRTATGPRLNKDGTPRKPRGSAKQAGTSENARFVAGYLEKALFSMHVMAAAMLSEPDLCIDEAEAKILADALEKVAVAYNFSTLLSPKAQASIDLTIALVTVYGSRVMKIARKQRRPMRNVTPITQTGTETK
jgi:hypothetical protein